MSIIVIAVPETATDQQWAEVHKALAIVVGSQVVEAATHTAQRTLDRPPVQGVSTSTSSGGRRGAPPKGSQEAKDRMAAVRAAGAAKRAAERQARQDSQQASTPTGRLDRMAVLAGKAGQAQASAETVRYANLVAADVTDDAWNALRLWALGDDAQGVKATLVVPDRQNLVASWLEGKCTLGELDQVVTKKGRSTLAKDAHRILTAATAD